MNWHHHSIGHALTIFFNTLLFFPASTKRKQTSYLSRLCVNLAVSGGKFRIFRTSRSRNQKANKIYKSVGLKFRNLAAKIYCYATGVQYQFSASCSSLYVNLYKPFCHTLSPQVEEVNLSKNGLIILVLSHTSYPFITPCSLFTITSSDSRCVICFNERANECPFCGITEQLRVFTNQFTRVYHLVVFN